MSESSNPYANYGVPRPRTCQWMGGSSEENQSCNHEVLEGKSYCEYHYHKCFTVLSEKEAQNYFDKVAKKVDPEKDFLE